MLAKLLGNGILDVLVPVEINGKEEFILGTGNITDSQVQEYLDRLNEYYETKFYQIYEKVMKNYLKEINQFEWVKLMNNYKDCAEEIILKEMIYV